MTVILGIDPGITGAIAVFHNDVLLGVHDIPVHGDPKVVDARELHRLVQREQPDLIVVEKVHAMPKNGSKAAFSLGDSAAVIRTVAAIEGVPYFQVSPPRWKAHHALLRKDKDAGRRLATELFPSFEAHFNRVRDHNRADAVLIGRWYVDTHPRTAAS